MLDVVFGQASDPGKVRTNNEDAMGVFYSLFAPPGPVAWVSFCRCRRGRRHGSGRGGFIDGHLGADRRIREGAIGRDAHQPAPAADPICQSAVHDRTLAPEYRGKRMATTVVACALRHDQAIVSHVGDSRCYLVRTGRPSRLPRTTPG